MSSQSEEQQNTPADAQSSREALIALQEIYIETEKLYHQSNEFIARIYGHGEISMGKRSVLLSLFSGCPQTIPQIAQAQSVSRQYTQKLVGQLAEEGYVTFAENTAHKRSHLVQFPTEGGSYMENMLRREMKIVAAQVIDFPNVLRFMGGMLLRFVSFGSKLGTHQCKESKSTIQDLKK